MLPNEIHTLYPVAVTATGDQQAPLLKRAHPAWLNFLSRYNVAIPVRKDYRTGPFLFSIPYVLGFSEKSNEDFLNVNKQYIPAVQEEFAIIAITDKNDFIFMNHDTGWIYYGRQQEVIHAANEEELAEILFYLAGSITDFIEALKKPRPSLQASPKLLHKNTKTAIHAGAY